MSLTITRGENRLISREGIRAPHLFQVSNGNLLLSFHVQADQHYAKRINLISRDKGQTWEQTPQRNHRETAWGETSCGVVLAYDRDTLEAAEGLSIGLYHRSTDGGETWEGPLQTEVHVPRTRSRDYPLSPTQYPEETHPLRKFFQPIPDYYLPVVERASHRTGFSFFRYLVELDGKLLAAMQGQFHGDRGERAILVSSTNKGQSWHFVTTIASEQHPKTDGMCEPAICRVADGSLLAILRRGSRERLAQCRSTDGGQTWSEPLLLAAWGVDPDLHLMSNGVLACTYGRPGTHVMFSEDGSGHSWGYSQPVTEQRSSCYMGITEIHPGHLLLTFDQVDSDQPGASRQHGACSIWSTTLQVQQD